ncbi:transcriptional regulator [Alphaproteobacteria bacterium]|nr:transcriptional regulator [Alphaproteobacteria bacterium]
MLFWFFDRFIMSSDYGVDKMKNSSKDLDVYIGSKIKFRRSMLSISQDKLGSHLGVTFQQIQKYEKGSNRVSASMLYHIADFLDVNIAYFTDGFENATKALHEDSSNAYDVDVSKKKESIDLLKAYYKITNPVVRRKVLDLVKAFPTTME